jgi:hypothetical protein
MVLPADHPAKSGEEALGLIGANAVIHERQRVIDPLGGVPAVQGIPAGRFIGKDHRARCNAAADHRNAFVFRLEHSGQGAAHALAKGHHDPTLAGLVLA